MANIYTDIPKKEIHYGEYLLAKQLSGFMDNKLHLWFSINFLPNVNDIDLLVYHETGGILLVEIKAVPLNAIETFGFEKCKISGRDSTKSPQVQALNAKNALKDFFSRELFGKIPFIIPTVCWPKISRKGWNDYWKDKRVCGKYSESMIFKEDLYSGPESFAHRLFYIWKTPPIGTGPINRFIHDNTVLESIKGALNIQSTPEPAPSDIRRLRIIEKEVSNDVLKRVSFDSYLNIVFRGYPGTGKTFRLLQIGAHHALHNRKVLFCCFNKVLASDIIRIIKLSKLLKKEKYTFDIYDVFDLLLLHASALNIFVDSKGKDHDVWGELLTEELTSRSHEIFKYDTILIDEAQDMKNWMLEMISLHQNKKSTVCAAFGTGQELYGETSDWIKQFSKNAETIQLKRNFRNTKPAFQFAHIFFETKMDTEKISSALKHFKRDPQALLPNFDRIDGGFPLIREINDSEVDWDNSDSPFFSEQLSYLMAENYEEIIEGQLNDLKESERPIDLLILVPSERCSEREWVSEALSKLKVNYIDYTNDDNRRLIARPDQVRLCTFHSSRGLEGMRVILFGIEMIDKLSKKIQVPLNHLGYIILSRSLFETFLIRRSTRIDWNSMVFLSKSLSALRSRQMDMDP